MLLKRFFSTLLFFCLVVTVLAEEPVLNVPILFVKRHNFLGLHIYDTFYKWRPGGGIYVLENPADPPEKHRIRTVIDPTTPETLGEGVYSHPDLSYDAKHVLFCFKASQYGGTSIYEIGIDGKGLRGLTDCNSNVCNKYQGVGNGNHDVMPAYLPDGRIVFTSTRYSGLVPCANNGVNILHVMNADGSDIHPISVNNVNEFDPSVMPDGRILFGRWEYIDKNALTQQSTWTVYPDGTNETAQFANNLVFPEATLQLQPVPGASYLVCSTFAKHNGPPRGSIAMIDLRKGKDEISAITNFEHPDNPTYDLGESCDPFPLSENLVLYSGQPEKNQKNALMLIDRNGKRQTLLTDTAIDLHNPIPVEPRLVPPILSDQTDRSQTEGHFFVQDVYAGNPDVPRGSIKWLRVIEETSRISPSPGPTVLNQTFLVSAALAFSAKNYIGIIPVQDDGRAYFTVPSGKAVYFQLLDQNYRLVRSMRTFIQAAPGTTRSCIGCHEYTTPLPDAGRRAIIGNPSRLQPETWGSGPMDYPSMIQPILDKHCVQCHGGEKGMEAGLDLTGGWTEHFSNSYENLVSRREVIYDAPLIGGIDCMNGTAHWSAKIFEPYQHGSGNATLADIVCNKTHSPDLTENERELLLAWIDSNGLYYGTWNYTKDGYALSCVPKLQGELKNVMLEAGCGKCHENLARFESDWINLENPQLSRVLRAPLAKESDGLGLEFCRDAKVDPNWRRLQMVTNSTYAHAVKALEQFPSQKWRTWDKSGEPIVSFDSTQNPYYQKMLRLIQNARSEALQHPRIDMPGGVSIAGQFRQILPVPLPKDFSDFHAVVELDGVVNLRWERSTKTFGLTFLVYRNNGADADKELLAETTAFQWTDTGAKAGMNNYTLIPKSGEQLGDPLSLSVSIPKTPVLPRVKTISASPTPGCVELTWSRADEKIPVLYAVYRRENDRDVWQSLTETPITSVSFNDTQGDAKKAYQYAVSTVSRRGDSGEYSEPVVAAPLPEPHDVLFNLSDNIASGTLSGDAKNVNGVLEITKSGQLTIPHQDEYNASRKITVDFEVKIDEKTAMPIMVSFGKWNEAGWFVQLLGDKWRWHLAGLHGVNCDGGSSAIGRWTHLTCHYDGKTMRIWQDGKIVAEQPVSAMHAAPWNGNLVIGNYSGGANDSYQLRGSIRNVRITNDARGQE
ncbi:MAG: hypothetical protein LBJ67_14640 [Planctomycetaceae bacterium]|jgi:hypothetical protein|nr:hypothetical protein [Planctomycetaceae bacterium]